MCLYKQCKFSGISFCTSLSVALLRDWFEFWWLIIYIAFFITQNFWLWRTFTLPYKLYVLWLCVCVCVHSLVMNDYDRGMLTSRLDLIQVLEIIIIIIKRISRAPIYHTRWQHRALYNNTNPPAPHTHTHDMHARTHTHIHARTHVRARTHTHTVSNEGMGRAVKNSLEIVIKQMRLEGGFKRGGRIRVAECLRQIVPDRLASIRKRSFTKCFCVYARGGGGGGGVTKVHVSDADRNCLAGV